MKLLFRIKFQNVISSIMYEPIIIYVVVFLVLACRYFSSLILVEGMDIDFLHKCALEDCTDQHQFHSTPEVTKVGRAASVV